MVVGDQVMATDPETGENGSRTVEALIRNTGPHLMVAVGTNKAGGGNTTSDTIDATDNHPFWVQSRGEWVEAIALQPGDVLLDEQGNDILVTELAVTEQDLTAYNLTIEDIHTYYAGDQPTLVHSCDLGESIAGHMEKNNRTFHNVSRGETAEYIEALIHRDITPDDVFETSTYGQTYFRHGRNIIIDNPRGPDGGTGFSKSSVQDAMGFLQDRRDEWFKSR